MATRNRRSLDEENQMNKTKHITFRCTEKQYQIIKLSAEELEMKTSTFILRTLMTSKVIKKVMNRRWIERNKRI